MNQESEGTRGTIFLSSTTRGLKPYRELLTQIVGAHGFRPIVQEHFQSPGRQMLEMIERKIDSSDGVFCLVGHHFGHLSPFRDPGGQPISYTQYEWLYAFRSRKPLVTLVTTEEVVDANTGEDSSDAAMFQEGFRRMVRELDSTGRSKSGWGEFGSQLDFLSWMARFRWDQWPERRHW